jgi:hypothetical protein
MTAANLPAALPPRGAPRLVFALGLIVLVLGAAYWLFTAVDGVGLARRTETGTVVGMRYQAAGVTYVTEVINNRPHAVRHATPEAYLVEVALAGGRAEGATGREAYEQLRAGDRVRVTYERRRVTGAIRVVDVQR